MWGLGGFRGTGPPDADPDLLEAMRLEHAGGAAFPAPGGGGAMTTPVQEWDMVVAGRCDDTAGVGGGVEGPGGGGGGRRRIPDWRELLRAEELAAAVDVAEGEEKTEGQAAALTGAEIVAIVLYTGPMVRPRPRCAGVQWGCANGSRAVRGRVWRREVGCLMAGRRASRSIYPGRLGFSRSLGRPVVAQCVRRAPRRWPLGPSRLLEPFPHPLYFASLRLLLSPLGWGRRSTESMRSCSSWGSALRQAWLACRAGLSAGGWEGPACVDGASSLWRVLAGCWGACCHWHGVWWVGMTKETACAS